MIHAYNEEYLSDAMENLGEAFDYAVYAEGLSLNDFMYLFINSKIAQKFQEGNPKYISGMSGTELVLETLVKSGRGVKNPGPLENYDRSSEYWSGWILAYYQWYSGKSFAYIQEYLPVEDIHRLYNPLHEAPEQKFLETAQAIIDRRILADSARKI